MTRNPPDSTSEAHAILADPIQRTTLEYLYHSDDDTATLEELVGELTEATAENPQSLRTRLHHTKLPRLHQARVIDYDARTNTVCYLGNDLIESYINAW